MKQQVGLSTVMTIPASRDHCIDRGIDGWQSPGYIHRNREPALIRAPPTGREHQIDGAAQVKGNFNAEFPSGIRPPASSLLGKVRREALAFGRAQIQKIRKPRAAPDVFAAGDAACFV